MRCDLCGGELVEVDNPMRREFRHRRGAECSPGLDAVAPEQRDAARDRLRRAFDAGLIRLPEPGNKSSVFVDSFVGDMGNGWVTVAGSATLRVSDGSVTPLSDPPEPGSPARRLADAQQAVYELTVQAQFAQREWAQRIADAQRHLAEVRADIERGSRA